MLVATENAHPFAAPMGCLVEETLIVQELLTSQSAHAQWDWTVIHTLHVVANLVGTIRNAHRTKPVLTRFAKILALSRTLATPPPNAEFEATKWIVPARQVLKVPALRARLVSRSKSDVEAIVNAHHKPLVFPVNVSILVPWLNLVASTQSVLYLIPYPFVP